MPVYAKTYGRMGNNMFQIGAAIGYGLKHNIPYIICPLIKKNTLSSGQFKFIKEIGHGFQELPYYAQWRNKIIVLDGYFQSEKYFSHCREAIIKELGFKWEPKPSWVAIHVRRGDYLLYPDKHPVVTVEYCEKAMAHFSELGYTSFMVFSDDIPWCQEAFAGLPYTFAYSIGRDEREDLELMSGCAHQICSNSTYAWWGYWLNQNPDKIGIMPKVWFGPGNSHLETKDIYPEKAIIL